MAEFEGQTGFLTNLDPAVRRAFLDMLAKIDRLEALLTAVEARVFELENP